MLFGSASIESAFEIPVVFYKFIKGYRLKAVNVYAGV